MRRAVRHGDLAYRPVMRLGEKLKERPKRHRLGREIADVGAHRIKRAMAADYSRELSVKVFAAHARMAKRGFLRAARPAMVCAAFASERSFQASHTVPGRVSPQQASILVK